MAKSVTLKEEIAKAEADARKKAKEAGLDEAGTQETVNEAVAKVKASFEKAVKEENPSWLVKVKNNPNFCGIGAGGVQFANGKAVITSKRMADWFTEHEGYEVIKQ